MTTVSSKPINTRVKDLLAKLMAVEDITVEHRANVSTAFFNTSDRILTLPIWEQMSGSIYDMLVAHEIGHALYTPADEAVVNAARNRLNPNHHDSAHAFLNICEDARIERRVKEKYPGSRRSFRAGYEWMMEQHKFMPKGTDIDALRFIDRVNIHYKLGFAASVKFSAEEQILVDELLEVYTWEEMVDVAEKMYRLAQKQKQAEKNPQTPTDPPQPQGQPGGEGQQQPPSTDVPDPDGDENETKDTRSSDDDTDDGDSADSTDGDGDSDGDDGDSSDGKSDRDSTDNKDESDDTDADGKSKSDESGDEDGDSDDKSSDGKSSDGANDAAPGDVTPDMPKTDENLSKGIEDMVDRSAKSRVYSSVPTTISKNIIVDYKKLHRDFKAECGSYDRMLAAAKKDLKKFEIDSRPIVNTMAQRFGMKKAADVHRRSMVAKTGRLNPDRLPFYKLTDDIFLRNTVNPDGTNHGLVMFIDWSGSMSDNMEGTIRQLLNLVLFCRKVNIPFEVYGFTNSYGNGSRETQKGNAEGDLILGSFALHNWFSGRMRASEFRTAMLHMTMLMGNFKSDAGCWSYRRRRSRRSTKYRGVPGRYGLGGTPLDDAIIAAMDIVPAFQRDNDVQIVNTVFLTDGATSSSPVNTRRKSNGQTEHVAYSSESVIRDPLTHREYRLRDYTNTTALLLTMLRERTRSTLIGFYLLDGYNRFSSNFAAGTSNEVLERERKRFKTDKFAVSTSEGYDEYYLLPGNDLDTTTKTVAGANASETFAKTQKSKKVNRVLLHRFTDLIAE